ncbi:MAG: hypothetical protein IV090_02945 [Candidatus Sericytochromatia bacterium]|nr:hypothetical protein [Candidatus Sericytochromatia bacterium]
MSVELENKTPLSRLELIFNQIGLPSFLVPKDAEMPFEYLLVALDEDQNPKPQNLLKLVFMEDILNTPGEQGETVEHPERLGRFATLQFYLEQPVKLPTARLLDTYRLVSAMSSLMPNGALVLNEAEKNNVVYYSHTLMMRPDSLDIGPVIDLIEQTRFFLNRFLPKIHEMTNTAKSLKQILAEAQKSLVAATQPPSA